ncbi:MAG: hypothetical protein MUE87_01165 [Methanothrix sp.]|nr:hypothetical protein [Methanothrix sp.]
MKGNLLCLVVIAILASALVAGLFYAAAADDDRCSRCPGNESKCSCWDFVFDETSTVRGAGEVSIKGKFNDPAAASKGWMKGSGSISLESIRGMSKTGRTVDFVQKSDLVFAGGQLKNRKSLSLPPYYNGLGATVSERFNLSHVDKSETNIIRSINGSNNTMLYETAQAYEGLWGIKNMQGWFNSRNKSARLYTGSYQAQWRFEFNDSAIK